MAHSVPTSPGSPINLAEAIEADIRRIQDERVVAHLRAHLVQPKRVMRGTPGAASPLSDEMSWHEGWRHVERLRAANPDDRVFVGSTIPIAR